MKKLILAWVCVCAALPSWATLVDFEGLWDFSPISNGYGGLNWTTNSWSLNGTTYVDNPSGYKACKVSGDMVGYTNNQGVFGWATTDGTNFKTLRWNIGAAWRYGLDVTMSFFDGGFGGTLLATQQVDPEPLAIAPTLWTLAMSDWADAITFTVNVFSGFHQYGYDNGDGAHLVFDDIEYTLAPEPGSLAVFGLGGALLLRRRR